MRSLILDPTITNGAREQIVEDDEKYKKAFEEEQNIKAKVLW